MNMNEAPSPGTALNLPNRSTKKNKKFSDVCLSLPEQVELDEASAHLKLKKNQTAKAARAVPDAQTPANLCVKVKVIYNTYFRNYIVNNGIAASADDAIRQIIDETNRIYTLPGLDTKITVSLVGDPVYDSNPNSQWIASGSWLQDTTVISQTSDSNVNHFAFFTADQTSGDSTIGIAYVETTCIISENSKHHFSESRNPFINHLL